YTMMPSREDPQVLVFGIDPEENFADKSHAGDVYKITKGEPIRFGETYASTELHDDQWGSWLGAYAPVKDSQGQTVAIVGAYMSAARVSFKLRPLVYSLLLSLGLGALLSAIVAFVHSKRVSQPLLALRQAVDAIGKGNLETRLELARKDEFGAVAHAINEMAEGLRERETVKTAFARYVSGQVLDTVLSSGQMPTVTGSRRRVTVIFSAIRGFTDISERLRPQPAAHLLTAH